MNLIYNDAIVLSKTVSFMTKAIFKDVFVSTVEQGDSKWKYKPVID